MCVERNMYYYDKLVKARLTLYDLINYGKRCRTFSRIMQKD